MRYFNNVTTNAVQNSCGRGASVGPRTRRYACFLVPRCLSARGCVLRSSLIARCLGHDAALDLWNVRTVDPLQLLTILQRQGVPGTISANGHGEAPSSSSSRSRSRSTSSAGHPGGATRRALTSHAPDRLREQQARNSCARLRAHQVNEEVRHRGFLELCQVGHLVGLRAHKLDPILLAHVEVEVAQMACNHLARPPRFIVHVNDCDGPTGKQREHSRSAATLQSARTH